MDAWGATMETADGNWRVDVGGVGAVRWYRLVGVEMCRNLPSTEALVRAADENGVDLADLHEVPAAA